MGSAVLHTGVGPGTTSSVSDAAAVVEKMKLFVPYLLSSMRRAMVRPSASS